MSIIFEGEPEVSKSSTVGQKEHSYFKAGRSSLAVEIHDAYVYFQIPFHYSFDLFSSLNQLLFNTLHLFLCIPGVVFQAVALTEDGLGKARHDGRTLFMK